MITKRMRRGLVGLSLCAGMALAVSVQAATYSYFYTADQNSYTVAPGSNVTVNLFLQEVNSDQSSSSLLADEQGLSQAGVSVQRISGSSQTTITSASPNAGDVPNGFDDPSSTALVNSPGSATITESTDGFAVGGSDLVGVEAGPQVNGVSDVLLGVITIHASSLPGQTTVFTADVANPAIPGTYTNANSYDLDNNGDFLNPTDATSLYDSAAPTNFSIITTAPTPEPTSLALFGLAALTLTKRPSRKRR